MYTFLLHETEVYQANVWQESKCNILKVPDDDPALIARALTCMYLGAYSNSISPVLGFELPTFTCGIVDSHAIRHVGDRRPNQRDLCKLHISACIVADKYDIVSMQKYSRQEFVKAWYESVDSNGYCIEGNEDDEDEKFEAWFTPHVQAIVLDAYEDTPAHLRDFRDPIVASLLLSMEAEPDNVRKNTAFRKCLKELPNLAADLLTHRLGDGTKCSSCGEDGSRSCAIGECRCGKEGLCKEKDCQEYWVERSVCIWCHEGGSMSYPISARTLQY